MNFKELLPAIFLALLTTVALQYFFSPRKASQEEKTAQSGRQVQAPQSTHFDLYKPLNIEVDFIDKEKAKKPVVTTITTDHARYEFSTDGASLQRVEFKRNWGGAVDYLSTVFPPALVDKEQRCFLVGLQDQTPYYYDFIEQKEEQDRYVVSYKAQTETAIVTKHYYVNKHEFKIDLELSLEPQQAAKPIQARLFFPSPIVADLGEKDTISAIMNDEKNKIKTHAKNEQLLDKYWIKPTLFGGQDRYFVHTLITDSQQFAQRGYYKVTDLHGLTAILEGPEISEKATFLMSFYFGPKEDEAMVVVDPRLAQTINYGWLAPISKPISKFLLMLLNWLYSLLKNYGLAIIAITVLLRLLLLPFTLGAEKSRVKQLEFQKKLKHIEMRYKNDKEALAQARAELVKKHGMPGLGGCLPILFQFPFFIALSLVAGNAIELYQAPFLWISDLSSRDPYYIIPVLVAVTMLFHSPTPDPKQRLTGIGLALVVGAVAANLSAALALYILTSTLLGVVQIHLAKRFA